MKNNMKISLLALLLITLLTSCTGKNVKNEVQIDTNIVQDEEAIKVEDNMENKEEVKVEVIDNKPKMIEEPEMIKEKEEIVVMNKGEYLDYSVDKLSNTKGKKVLFFHATWCPSCVSADKMLKSSTIPDDITIFKTDYDSYGDLKTKYEVLTQHTFVQIDESGEVLTKWVGARDIADIESRLK